MEFYPYKIRKYKDKSVPCMKLNIVVQRIRIFTCPIQQNLKRAVSHSAAHPPTKYLYRCGACVLILKALVVMDRGKRTPNC